MRGASWVGVSKRSPRLLHFMRGKATLSFTRERVAPLNELHALRDEICPAGAQKRSWCCARNMLAAPAYKIPGAGAWGFKQERVWHKPDAFCSIDRKDILSEITYFLTGTTGAGATGSVGTCCCCCCWQETKAAAVRARIAIFFIIILLVLMLFDAPIKQG